MRKFKENKGITLVALIITIIILLILAVVSISAVTGDGIIAKAKQARTSYEQAQAEEQELLDNYLAYLDDTTSVFGNITSLDYGKSIEYNDPAGVNDWKVFYKDDNYLYIITSDYLESEKLPETLTMSKIDTLKYIAYWSDETSFKSSGTSTIESDSRISKYKLSWLKSNSTSNNNAKATADLLNIDAWTAKFGNSSKKIEAIGSPTLEMWVASWNANNGYIHLNIDYDTTGYYISTTDTPKEDESTYVDLSNDKGYKNRLYFPYDTMTDGCSGYWLASPDRTSTDKLKFVYYDGDITMEKYSAAGFSVRPLVAVPKNLINTDTNGNFIVE